MYEAFMKRKALESAERVKQAMISGIWANTNFDDDKNSRQKALLEIEENYQEAVRELYNNSPKAEISFEEDPFFAAMKLPPIPESTTTT